MKKDNYLIIFLSFVSALIAQNRIGLQFGYNRYLDNSENSTRVLRNEEIKSCLIYGLDFKKVFSSGYALQFDYIFSRSKQEDVLDLYYTSESGPPEPMGFIHNDYILIHHNLDIAYTKHGNRYYCYGIGPSVVLTNRTIDIKDHVNDRLASYGLGVHGFLELLAPIDNTNRIFIVAKLKIRYTHSIWFDAGLRNLDDYSQEFFTANGSIGLGYSF